MAKARYERNPDLKMIREWLNEIRVAKKLSSKDIGDLTGYSAEYVERVERGETDLTFTVIFRYFEAMGYEIVIRKKDISTKTNGKNGRARQQTIKWEELGAFK